ncbi:MAG TPA: hypothetical protein VKE69_10655 [Planctomycetota bacterium]|nr:hypothetical protein [Planctomycetota bacterium]
MSDYLDFYSEKKYCRRCGRYVRYLVSLSRSYCALCGESVNLFSKEDWQKFRRRSLPNKKKSSFLSPISRKSKPIERD